MDIKKVIWIIMIYVSIALGNMLHQDLDAAFNKHDSFFEHTLVSLFFAGAIFTIIFFVIKKEEGE